MPFARTNVSDSCVSNRVATQMLAKTSWVSWVSQAIEQDFSEGAVANAPELIARYRFRMVIPDANATAD